MQTKPNDQHRQSESLAVIEPVSPPNSIEAEQAVLGAILFKPDTMLSLIDFLSPKDFYRTAHQNIYATMMELFKAGEPIDNVMVGEWMSDAGVLDASGGRTYLMDLALSVTTAENAVFYGRKVKEKALLRSLIRIGRDITSSSYEGSAEEVLNQAQNAIMDISQEARTRTTRTQGDITKTALEQLLNPSLTRGVETGFYDLDKMINGLQKGCTIVIGAATSMGKSAFALSVGSHVAKTAPAIIFSLEMPEEQLARRALCALAEVPLNCQPNDFQQKKLIQAHQEYPKNLQLFFRPGLTTAQVRAELMKLRIAHGDLGVVFIDYIQIMAGSGENKAQEISKISQELKRIAGEFNVPIVILSQVSRRIEERQDKRPMKCDLRDSGSIENDADVIMFLYRDEYYNKQTTDTGIAEVIVSKLRDGATGTVKLAFRGEITKFKNLGFRA